MGQLLDEAIVFATHAHAGQVRKMANTPYILHPLEVASIIATMTGDAVVNVLTAEFNSEIGIKTDNGIFLDPSNETAQQLICDGVKEIAENYDVDGIQFDDYFYPTEDESFDKKQYEAYIEK